MNLFKFLIIQFVGFAIWDGYLRDDEAGDVIGVKLTPIHGFFIVVDIVWGCVEVVDFTLNLLHFSWYSYGG